MHRKTMMVLCRLLIFSCVFLHVHANFTKISRKNVLLSRRKRYLTFPMGSNLVMTMSMVKSFLQIQPRGYNVILEVDVPFALPSDPKLFLKKEKKHKHRKERRSIYSQLDAALTQSGLNGTTCVTRMICDAQKYIPERGKSLVKDMLMAIFTSSESDLGSKYSAENCNRSKWIDCEVPLLDYILKSFTLQQD
ncbi:hypothetical protein NQ315_002959 [Exocentrus adspersus]|uniref:Uncharacterized protein n=1 Tax=Exocentrus adspersus TaxID=1586481 RepID=A0AAV8W4S4_9CUCU|nr:hypothetical protein NQ315_002959 [Exocentrus adspersus]